VTFLGLMVHNVSTRLVRSMLTAFAVAIGVMTVVTLGLVTSSLRDSAAAVLQVGKADFTVAQKGVTDVLNSTIDDKQVKRVASYPGVTSAVGVFIRTTKLDKANPLFLEIGIPPRDLTPFGVSVVSGRPFTATAPNEVMLGWRIADDLGKHVGDPFVLDGHRYTVVGIFRTGQVFGDGGAMLPLVTLQGLAREPGTSTLVFVRTRPGTLLDPLRAEIAHDNPSLATITLATGFGQVDRNLDFLTAAAKGATILAWVVGVIIVANTMLLSFVQRTREFGLLRAVGWARWRVIALVIGEALRISVVGAALGIGLSFAVVSILEQLPALVGLLHPTYTSTVFVRAFYTAVGIGLLGALYPGIRAGVLQPLAALREE
jgi:putative ABC transport system permease protein